MTAKYLIIGSGQTGLLVARELAKKHKVVLVEEHEIGGSFVYSLDIPQDAVLQAIFQNLKSSEAKEYVNKTVQKKAYSIREEIRNHKNITLVYGKAEFENKNNIKVVGVNTTEIISFEECILCTGKNQMLMPKIQGIEKISFLYQHNCFFLEEIPKTLAVIGCTQFSLTVADIYTRLGSKVVLFEEKEVNQVLNEFDPTCFNFLLKSLSASGVEFNFETKIEAAHKGKVNLETTAKNGSKKFEDEESSLQKLLTNNNSEDGLTLFDNFKNEYHFDQIFIRVKEKYRDRLELGKIGIKFDGDGIITTQAGQTTIPNITALGQGAKNFSQRTYHSSILSTINRVNSKNEKSTSIVLFGSGTQTEVKPFNFSISELSTFSSIITLGLPYNEAAARYGLQIKFDIFREPFKGEENGFIKIVYNQNSGQVIGFSLSGKMSTHQSLCKIMLYKNYSYKDVTGFLKMLSMEQKI